MNNTSKTSALARQALRLKLTGHLEVGEENPNLPLELVGINRSLGILRHVVPILCDFVEGRWIIPQYKLPLTLQLLIRLKRHIPIVIMRECPIQIRSNLAEDCCI